MISNAATNVTSSRKERKGNRDERGVTLISRKSLWQLGLPSGRSRKSWMRRMERLAETQNTEVREIRLGPVPV